MVARRLVLQYPIQTMDVCNKGCWSSLILISSSWPYLLVPLCFALLSCGRGGCCCLLTRCERGHKCSSQKSCACMQNIRGTLLICLYTSVIGQTGCVRSYLVTQCSLSISNGRPHTVPSRSFSKPFDSTIFNDHKNSQR